ncbi:MAG: hypothetical protein ABJA02_09705 [Acidobacteriota bacterium]
MVDDNPGAGHVEAKWIEFDEGAARPRNKMHVTLSFDGNILMNRFTFEAMGSPANVVMLFDPVNRRIGIRPAAADARNSFELRQRGPRTTRRVRAQPFVKKWNIIPDRTIKFRDPEIDNGILILDLNPEAVIHPKPLGGRRRSQQPPSAQPRNTQKI